MGLAGALQLGGRPADDRLQLDEARLVGHGAGRVQRGLQRGDVLDVLGVVVGPVHRLHVPAVRGVAGRDVLGQRDVGVVLDRDPVAVVDQGEVAQPLGAGQRGRLAAHPLLDVAVGGQAVDVVVEGRLTGCGVGVQQPPLAALGHRHADRVGDALAQRPGGDLHAVGVPVLRVPGGLRVPGPQRLDVVQLETEAAEVELEVERQAGVPAGQHEAVAARPVGVGGVVPHHLLEQQVRDRRQTHRRARVAVADLLHGVGGEHPDGVDGAGVQVGPPLRHHGLVCFGGIGHGLAFLPRERRRSGRDGPACEPIGVGTPDVQWLGGEQFATPASTSICPVEVITKQMAPRLVAQDEDPADVSEWSE